MSHYAWSNIQSSKVTGETAAGVPKVEHTRVKFGEEVSAEKLGIPEEDFNEMVNSGAVREFAPPELPENYQDSPVNFMKDVVRRVERAATTLEGGGLQAGINQSLLQRAFRGPLPTVPENINELNDTGSEPPPAQPDPEKTHILS